MQAWISHYPRPLINNPSPLNRVYNRDPHVQALARREFINHGSTLSVLPAQGLMILGGLGSLGVYCFGSQLWYKPSLQPESRVLNPAVNPATSEL